VTVEVTVVMVVSQFSDLCAIDRALTSLTGGDYGGDGGGDFGGDGTF
jgi:hypothetical protein